MNFSKLDAYSIVLTHPLAEGIRRVGFRKWHERELMAGHVHLVLALLSLLALLASFEAFDGAAPLGKLLDVLFVLVCAAISLWALRRYLFLLGYAEAMASQATCKACGEYGRLEVVSEDRPQRLTGVCCRKCAHRWAIES